MGAQATEALMRQMREQRMAWLDLAPGKRLRVIRPTEVEMARYMDNPLGQIQVVLEQVSRFVVDWEGITGADLLGPAMGAADPVPFDPALWAAVVADRSDWLMLAAARINELATTHVRTVQAARKNS